MSNYLVNLARRSAGLVPAAQPRVVPGGGVDTRLVHGPTHQTTPPTTDRAAPGTLITGSGRHADDGLPDALAPRHVATNDVTRRDREPEPDERDAPRQLRLIEPAASSVRRDDAGMASLPGARPIAADADAPITIGPAHDPKNEGPRDLHGPPNASVGPAVAQPGGTTPRTTVIEPAPSPAQVAGARTATEVSGRGRQVDVRIGTIEIHAEPASPPPSSAPPVAAHAPVGQAQGGFDDFVRLRTYAPWER